MKKVISISGAPKPIAPYSQAILSGNMLFISGQIPLNPFTGELVVENIGAQTTQIMKNLEAILKEAGMTFENVVKTSIFISDMKHFAEVNRVYGSYFPNNPPARETVAVAGLPMQVDVEISMIAVQ